MNNKTSIFQTHLFLISLVVLILNDAFLKHQFGNFLTGKLSDVAGLLVFVLFFRAVLNTYRVQIFVATSLLFAYWKSVFSQPLIDLLQFWHIPVTRVVDLSDLAVLPIVALFYFSDLTKYYLPLGNVAKGVVVCFSVVAMSATSIRYNQQKPIPFCDFALEYAYDIKASRAAILLALENQGYKVQFDTLKGVKTMRGLGQNVLDGEWQTSYLKIENIPMSNGDVVKQINFQISEKTTNNETVSQVQLMGICLNNPVTYGKYEEMQKKLKVFKKHIENSVMPKKGNYAKGVLKQ
jgi:hypothetical protein